MSRKVYDDTKVHLIKWLSQFALSYDLYVEDNTDRQSYRIINI